MDGQAQHLDAALVRELPTCAENYLLWEPGLVGRSLGWEFMASPWGRRQGCAMSGAGGGFPG